MGNFVLFSSVWSAVMSEFVCLLRHFRCLRLTQGGAFQAFSLVHGVRLILDCVSNERDVLTRVAVVLHRPDDA